MAPPFAGSIAQLGIVVADLDAAIQTWLRLGVGPFLTLRGASVSGYEYRGNPSKPLLDVAFAQKGDVQIELIRQANDAPSAYRDFIAAGSSGFHHFGWLCADYAAAVTAAGAANATVLQRGSWTGIHFAYYETTESILLPSELADLDDATRTAALAASQPGVVKIAELIESNDVSDAVFRLIRDEAAGWDGRTNPVRSLLSPTGVLQVGVDVLSHKLERWLHGTGREP
jgi:hypothetical protein